MGLKTTSGLWKSGRELFILPILFREGNELSHGPEEDETPGEVHGEAREVPAPFIASNKTEQPSIASAAGARAPASNLSCCHRRSLFLSTLLLGSSVASWALDLFPLPLR